MLPVPGRNEENVSDLSIWLALGAGACFLFVSANGLTLVYALVGFDVLTMFYWLQRGQRDMSIARIFLGLFTAVGLSLASLTAPAGAFWLDLALWLRLGLYVARSGILLGDQSGDCAIVGPYPLVDGDPHGTQWSAGLVSRPNPAEVDPSLISRDVADTVGCPCSARGGNCLYRRVNFESGGLMGYAAYGTASPRRKELVVALFTGCGRDAYPDGFPFLTGLASADKYL
jgi:hypothetical protein